MGLRCCWVGNAGIDEWLGWRSDGNEGIDVGLWWN